MNINRANSWLWGVAGILIGTQAASAVEPGAAMDPRIVAAIEAFEPFWQPSRDELKGCRVAIDPVGGSSVEAAARDRDDLCLWTASHLYHLVRNAGGFPALRRVDDRPALEITESSPPASGRRIFVKIAVVSGAQPQVSPASSHQGSQELVEALAGAGFVTAVPVDLDEARGVPAVVVTIPAVDPRQARTGRIPAHRAWAEQIYRGVAAYAATQRSQPASAEEKETLEGDPPVVPFYPRHAASTPVRRAATAIWSDGDLPPARAKWFCDLYVKQAFSDRTNVHFDPIVTTQGQSVVIRGTTNHTALLGTLETVLRAAGVQDVRSEMRLLPEEGRLDPERWFGACVAPMALNFGKPADGGPLQTQLLYGEAVFLLDRQDGFYLVQGGDGYLGWVRENCILPLTREQFRAYTERPEAVLLQDVVIDVGRIVRGSRLRVLDGEGDSMRIIMPDGKQASVPRLQARLADDRETHEARAIAALDLLHVPYLFAGRSSVGLDCSGLVATLCDAYGTVLPRDAAQQFVTGGLVATRWYPEGMRPGDRIYFINELGKIFHTGLSLGGPYFVHSSPPGVQISSFEKDHRLYREHWDVHFLGARRP